MSGSRWEQSKLAMVPQRSAELLFDGLDLRPPDWLVLYRVDGKSAFKDIVAASPLAKKDTLESLSKLLEARLIVLPVAEVTEDEVQEKPKKNLPTIPKNWPTPFENYPFDQALLDADEGPDTDLRQIILYFHGNLRAVNYYQVLGLEAGAGAKEVRREYFKLSKVFHPDRFFRQELGEFREMIETIFRWLNDAHKVLGDKRRKAEYDELLDRGYLGPWQLEEGLQTQREQPTKTRQEVLKARLPLAVLLQEAKGHERSGDFRAAHELYEEALKHRRAPELMNRSAECLIKKKKKKKKKEERALGAISAAPDVARYWVALAFICELTGRAVSAIDHYGQALVLDPNHQGAQTRLQYLLAHEP